MLIEKSLIGPKCKKERLTITKIFLTFLKLGCISFGGPIAHLGYFHEEFVGRLKWLSDHAYADLVALCQFLPGPAGSQVGIAPGLSKGGVRGAGVSRNIVRKLMKKHNLVKRKMQRKRSIGQSADREEQVKNIAQEKAQFMNSENLYIQWMM